MEPETGPLAAENQPPIDADRYSIDDEVEAARFVLRDNGELLGFASYVVQTGPDGDVVVVPHVETLPQHRGQGHAARLMDGLLEQVRASGRKIAPLCPFAAEHVRENSRYHDLVS